MSEPDHEDDTVLAAEYVLGLLDASERMRAIARVRSDPRFGAEVEAWERRLAALTDEIAPAQPQPEVWNRIARSLDADVTVVPFPARIRPWDRINIWRAATGAAFAAAALLAFFVFRPQAPASSALPPPPPALPILTATLSTAEGKALYVATIDRSRARVVVVPVSAVASGGRTPELWVIPAGGKPRPVGLVGGRSALSLAAGSTVLSVAETKSVLAVSLEPPGGSPTGAPTGPVIASGVVSSLS